MTLAIGVVVIVALIDTGLVARRSRPAPSVPTVRSVCRNLGNLPLNFEENRGQTDPQVKFLARGRGYMLFLTPTQAVLKLRAPSSAKKQTKASAVPVAFHPESIEEPKFSLVRIRLEGANTNSQASGIDQLPTRTNYFIGKDPAKWRRNVPTFAGTKFAGIYPGIDLVYRGNQSRLEYDFVVAPHTRSIADQAGD